MKYTQRDVVEVNFLLPNGELKPHMALEFRLFILKRL